METLWQNLKYGLRMLRRSPGFAVVAVLTLAVGIGANTAVFSVVNAFLLRPLPFDRPEQLAHLWGAGRSLDFSDMERVSESNFLDWKERTRAFADLGGYYYSSFNTMSGDEPVQVVVALVTPNVPELLGVQPILGRTFLPKEGQPGRNKVVLLGQSYWESHFDSDPNVLSRTVRLNDEPYTVIGVMPASFVFPFPSARLWAPLTVRPAENARSDAGPLLVIGRLRPEVQLEQAQAEMKSIAQALEKEHPVANKGRSAHVVPLREALLFFYDTFRLLSLTLLVAVGFVLLLVCSNVANLLLARAVGRSREVAIRAALGAGRRRLISQFLTEGAILALAGGAVGALLANWITHALQPVIPGELYHVGVIGVDGTVLIFSLIVSLLTVLLFALAPALQAARVNLCTALKEGERGGGAVRGRRLRSALVVTQLCLATVLLAGATFALRAFWQLRQMDPGFRAGHVLTMEMILPQGKYPSGEPQNLFYGQVVERTRAVPGVESAATIYPLPMNFELFTQELAVEGRTSAADEGRLFVSKFWASTDYFQVMQIPIQRGRVFTAEDDAGAPPVVVINQKLAELAWPAQDPVGRILQLLDPGEPARRATVIGVVGNAKDFLLHEELRPQVYLSQLQSPRRRRFLVVRTNVPPLNLVSSVRSQVTALDPTLPVTAIRSMDQVLFEALGPVVVAATVLGALGAGALLLAALGIYGVVSYLVGMRQHEFGVRMALGAQPRDVLRLVLGQGTGLTAIGVGIGMAVTVALVKVAQAAVGPLITFDLVAIVGTPAALAAVAILACWIPARRAMRVDPVIALRYE